MSGGGTVKNLGHHENIRGKDKDQAFPVYQIDYFALQKHWISLY